MSSVPDYKVKIPPEIVKFLDKAAPKDAKLLAARGLVPMAPDVLITALFLLSGDSDAEVRDTAKKSLLGQPETALINLLKQPCHAKVLDFYAKTKMDNSTIIEAILLNRYTPDETFVYLAPQVGEQLLTIIANNQERLLRCPKIGESLRKNPQASQSVIDRMVSFLRLNGIILEGVSEELTREEIQQIMAEDDQLLIAAIYNEDEDDSLENLSISLLQEEDDEDLTKEGVSLDDRQILKKLSELTVAEKIKLAIKGNREVRTVLIKDPNKLICTAVIKSPKIKDNEVISIAQMRSVHDEILRLIARNPEWTKNYQIKSSLVNNPKCPIPVAVQFIKHLRVNDLGMLSKNRNVSQQVRRFARQLYNQKR